MKLVEQVARAIYATDNGCIADRHPDGWVDWLPEARAALSVLARNVSDEMVAKIICSAIWKTPAMVEKMWPVFLPAAREVIDTLTTPIFAAGDEDRRAS